MSDLRCDFDGDLDWMAFCYAAGELDVEATAEFESLLATSQDAREKLAAMVALLADVASASVGVDAGSRVGGVEPVRDLRRSLSRVAWLGAGVAAVLLAVWVGDRLSRESGSVMVDKRGEAELATAWVETFDSREAVVVDEDEQAPAVSEFAIVDVEEEAVDVPGWMFAALGGEEVVDEIVPDEFVPDDERGGGEVISPEI